jgi:hypothetical protein
VDDKYPATNIAINTQFRTLYDSAPLGGFGGMGIVQLMAPPGDNSDGTNTVLDDNIKVIRAGAELTGAQKRLMLAWRGFPNSLGQGLDDAGNVITIGDAEGDIRPSPTLLPTPFDDKSRLRSIWIDTGSTVRRSIPADDGLPRGIIDTTPPTLAGPRYEFAGVDADPGETLGYADYVISQGSARLVYPTVVPPSAILGTNGNSSYLGQPAYRVQLSQPVLGNQADRYVQYTADLLAADGSILRGFRILAHTSTELVLATDAGALPAAATQAQVRAKFFEVFTNGTQGLGQTYLGSTGARVPIANVKIGFAFHQDPGNSTKTRIPANEGEFLYTLADPAVREMVREAGCAFVQWDVIFDTQFKTISGPTGDMPPALSPDTPRPEVHFLRLPFRF